MPAHSRTRRQRGRASSVGLAGAFEAGLHGTLANAIANADEFEDRAGASIAQAGLGEAQDARVAARPIGEPRGDLGEQHADGLLVAQQLQAAAAGGDRRGDGLVPLAATCRSCARSSRRRCRDRRWCRTWRPRPRPARPLRAIVMHFSTSGRTSLAFAIVVMMRPLTFGLLSSYSASRSVRNSALARFRSKAR